MLRPLGSLGVWLRQKVHPRTQRRRHVRYRRHNRGYAQTLPADRDDVDCVHPGHGARVDRERRRLGEPAVAGHGGIRRDARVNPAGNPFVPVFYVMMQRLGALFGKGEAAPEAKATTTVSGRRDRALI